MPPFLLSPLLKWSLAALGGAMVVHWVAKEARRINEELDQAKRAWEHTYAQVPAEYITLIWHYAQNPKEDVLYELETFMTKVLPNLEACAPEIPVGSRVMEQVA